jgi:DNA-binding NarL/FixJ family response regulator
MKLLLVDDHPLIQDAFRYLVPQLGPDAALLQATTAEDGLAMAQDVDLLLLDLSLPGLSGLSALETFRRRHPELPIVVLSSTEDPQVVLQALEAGAMGFIPKTSPTPVLLRALQLVASGGVYVPEQVLAYARTTAAPRPTAARPADIASDGAREPKDMGLTDRQAQVLALLVQGKPNKVICRELELADGTVRTHIQDVFRILNVHNRTQAVFEVSRLRLRLPGTSAPPHVPGQDSNKTK